MQGSSEAYEPAHRLQFASGPIPTLVVYWPKLHCLRKGRALIQVLRVIADSHHHDLFVQKAKKCSDRHGGTREL